MPQYAALLGHHPDISLAEIACAVPDCAVKRMIGPSVALFESAADLTNDDLRNWGGVFLLARGIPGASSLEELPKIVENETKNVKGKVTFSLRAFGVPRPALHALYRAVKKHLTSKGIPTRYIGSESKPPVSGQLQDTGLISGKGGCELLLLGNEDESFLWIGRTIAAQDPASYVRRDMEKPVRDTRAGMLPPKLAQIMLNFGAWLAQPSHSPSKLKAPLGNTRDRLRSKLTILDPFCGTGVIPMEALLRGWPVLASDASLKAVNGCEKNLEWIRKEGKILKRDVPSTVWKQDATKPFILSPSKGSSLFPDVIVTETMLGPPLTERPTAKAAAKYRSECDALEIAFLKNAAATLPGVPVVALWPVWFVKTGPVYLERAWNALHDLGYRAAMPAGAPLSHDRLTLVYRRPDQFVGREIVLLKPVKK